MALNIKFCFFLEEKLKNILKELQSRDSYGIFEMPMA